MDRLTLAPSRHALLDNVLLVYENAADHFCLPSSSVGTEYLCPARLLKSRLVFLLYFATVALRLPTDMLVRGIGYHICRAEGRRHVHLPRRHAAALRMSAV